MGKFTKGLLMGAAIGAAFEIMMMPQMDRRTQRSMRRAARKMRDVADYAYDGIHDWMS
ncbi:YtxH domain-containing protein [Clostridium sp. SM-530-WT-3G]|uniref:YtxH domain-containing protein n=1 Tax=Clostridium sp. SM-530-WT-3G TaxID=2725303 RepID=UPI00145CC6F8|nr:YtxH domain-containing protein [Clostridium sp. SM-530-WT-3G]NME82228.1 YtxH domain-containing protein [Clostridium sp. SM-530-WT-3G]